MVIGNGSVLSAPHANNTHDFVTIASTGNAVDFGDSTNTSRGKHATSSPTRGLFAGGHSATNVIEFFQIYTQETQLILVTCQVTQHLDSVDMETE